MLSAMRKNKILELLAESEVVEKKRLEEELGVSPSTVQRDLLAMEKEGLLVRFWGGARRGSNSKLYRRNMEERSVTSSMQVIGEIAASRVSDGELIFMGPGKTTLAMAEQIRARNITVITNGIPQLQALSKRSINVFLLCGFFKEYSCSVVGRQTIDMLASYRFDKAFLGVKGFDRDGCPLSGDEYEYEIKNICIQNATETYILADHTKFNRTAMYVTDPELARDLNIITDQKPEGFDRFKQEKAGFILKRNRK